MIFHQPRFPGIKGISLTKPPFLVRSCEVALIGPEGMKMIKIHLHPSTSLSFTETLPLLVEFQKIWLQGTDSWFFYSPFFLNGGFGGFPMPSEKK